MPVLVQGQTEHESVKILQDNPKFQILRGNLVSSIHRVKLDDGIEHGVFVFSELWVWAIGTYYLHFTLHEMRKSESGFCVVALTSCQGAPFAVLNNKDWAATFSATGATTLSRQLAESGVKLRVKKASAYKKKKTGDEWAATSRYEALNGNGGHAQFSRSYETSVHRRNESNASQHLPTPAAFGQQGAILPPPHTLSSQIPSAPQTPLSHNHHQSWGTVASSNPNILSSQLFSDPFSGPATSRALPAPIQNYSQVGDDQMRDPRRRRTENYSENSQLGYSFHGFLDPSSGSNGHNAYGVQNNYNSQMGYHGQNGYDGQSGYNGHYGCTGNNGYNGQNGY